jgi:light-regulated signal transduction histidine kinase (bacteriophytochrome)
VLSYIGLLEKRYGDKLEGDARTYMNFAADGARRMRALITDLLSYSRVESGGREFAEVDMNKALSTALSDLEAVIRTQGAEIESGDLPRVAADMTQMTQLFQNLVGNAIKYHGPEKPRISIGAAEDHEGWTFSVRDNGIGIAPEHQEKIFQMFHRLHAREDYEGTGIGLAIAKRIVDRHGGRIWVESGGKNGSTFFFTMPQRR